MIRYYAEGVGMPKVKRLINRQWIKMVCEKYDRKVGDIVFVFSDKQTITSLNKEYNMMDSLTDIIFKRTYQMKTNSNTLKMIISFICLTATFACSHDVMASGANEESLPDKNTIMVIKEKMLNIVDTSYFFWFSDDAELQAADPHAYWLMNRMMLTVQSVRTAEDGIAWVLALDENVLEYSRRIDRRIYEDRAEDAAARAIEDLIDIYAAGNQPELNTYSYVTSILETYKVINEYKRTMSIHMCDPILATLLYNELPSTLLSRPMLRTGILRNPNMPTTDLTVTSTSTRSAKWHACTRRLTATG